jgi:phage terminase large subunit
LKSYSVSILALVAMVDYSWNVLYTRFTNSTITDSVKPEVSDKIELLGYQGSVKDTESHIETKNNRIAFKGIKPGQKSATANLKSLSGFNCFINDEAEELPDFKTFKKIFYSIRDTSKRNLSILILNPTDEEHWIFNEFFAKKEVEAGSNCIVDNVMYIHSSYLDCDFKLMPANILADYERMKLTDPDEYENIVMGGWIKQREGLVFPKSELKRYKEFPVDMHYKTYAFADTADQGDNYFSMPIGRVYGNRVYLTDAIHDQYNLTIQEGQVQDKVKMCNINELIIETNSFGAYFSRRIRELIPGLYVFGQNAKANKMSRILANSGLIKYYFYFPENPTPTLQKFIDQVTKLMRTATKEDDAPDSLSGLCAYLDKFYNIFQGE